MLLELLIFPNTVRKAATFWQKLRVSFTTVLGAAIKCKPYSDITVEIGKNLKTVKITLSIFAVHYYWQPQIFRPSYGQVPKCIYCACMSGYTGKIYSRKHQDILGIIVNQNTKTDLVIFRCIDFFTLKVILGLIKSFSYVFVFNKVFVWIFS